MDVKEDIPSNVCEPETRLKPDNKIEIIILEEKIWKLSCLYNPCKSNIEEDLDTLGHN